MQTNDQDPDRQRDNRITLIVICPLLIIGLVALYKGLSPFLKTSPDRALQITGLIFEDVVIASVCFLGLAILWACFQPHWLKRPLDFAARHIFYFFCAIVLFLFVFCPLVTLLIEFFKR
jgi:uncharacterized membrane-anchored protein